MVSHGGCFSRQKEMPFLIQTTMAERRKALRTSMVKVAAFAAAFAPKSVGIVEQLHGFVREMGGFVPMLHAHFHGETDEPWDGMGLKKHTVDGCKILHQLIGPIIYRVSTILYL